MDRKARLFVLAGFLLSSFIPTVVLAQARNGAEADRLSKEGERLLEKHDAQGAIESLARAYGISNNPRYLLPLGLAYAEAERPLDAIDALGRFLKDAPAISDVKRKEIGARFAVMLDQVAASVTVEATRQNAPVKVDGRPVGATPLQSPLRLLPGSHEIIMQPAPTDPSSGARVVIEVKPGERRTVKLEPGAALRFLEPQAQGLPSGATDPLLDPAAPKLVVRPSAQPARPVYQKWWFWSAVGGGAATVLAVGLGAGLSSRGNSHSSEEFPNVPSWPGGPIDARPAAMMSLSGFSR